MSIIDDILDANKVKISIKKEEREDLGNDLCCYNFTYNPGRFAIPVILKKEDIKSGKVSLSSLAINNILDGGYDHFLIDLIRNMFELNGMTAFINNIRMSFLEEEFSNIYYKDDKMHILDMNGELQMSKLH